MDVLIAGSYGGVGQHITELLAESDYTAHAMVREESQVSEMEEEFGVDVVVADLTEDVSHAVEGCDAVIFAAGSSGEDVEGVDRDGAIRLIDAAEQEGTDRFVMLSSINADRPGESPEALQPYLEAKLAADEHLQGSDLTYTIVRPGALTDEPTTGRIEAARRVERGEITRADVARTLIATLDIENTLGETFELIEGDEPIESALESL
ncbi:NmrA-like family protein [Halalkalicoccus paucihalophilus]|uniref:NmrA-like family protein n=1 Tax=Halalkalicoccus paucihalophilus TaxID=1008153 RepID=A0A151AIF5_9EURY|nr:SDR family oxidoreductase [Halalkalicoccus paucihalophilus]KYH27403.1 NmrA-like family protein [Halalkalicoccus paucihalophilus]